MNEIRTLRPSDVPDLMRLSQAAGWNQILEDWARLLELEPEGCFGIEEDGRVVATTTAVCFDRRLAWIGMVLTDPAHRRRGLARRLMEYALEFLERRRIEWVKLDAAEMGRPLYAKLGFEDECAIERWAATAPAQGKLSASGVAPCSTACLVSLDSLAPWSSMDRRAFGADRSRVLENLARCETATVPGEGFAMGRPGVDASSFGPCVALSREAARSLVTGFLKSHPRETVYWDLLPENKEAVRLALEFGFAPKRRLVRMDRPGTVRAERPRADASLVYATAGFEYG